MESLLSVLSIANFPSLNAGTNVMGHPPFITSPTLWVFLFNCCCCLFVCLFSMPAVESRASFVLIKLEALRAVPGTTHRTQKNSQQMQEFTLQTKHSWLTVLVWSSAHTLKQMPKEREENTFPFCPTFQWRIIFFKLYISCMPTSLNSQ